MIDVAALGFRQNLARVAREAVRKYEAMSGMGPWNTPESWLQSAIAVSLENDFYVMLEVRTRDLLTWHGEQRRSTPGVEPSLIRSGRIDVVLFAPKPAPDPSEAEAVALIEVKKYAQRFDCNEDAERLRGIAREVQLGFGSFIVAYLQEVSEEKLQSTIRRLLEKQELDALTSSSVEPFKTASGECCAVVVAELQPQYDAVELQKLGLLRDAIEAGAASGIAEDFSFSSLNAMLDDEAERMRSGGEAV